MCIILFSCHIHPEYSLILAANRDEFYHRPTAPLGFWTDEPSVLGGRDLEGGGSWMGVTGDLKIAAVTNYRDPSRLNTCARSRGELVKRFLRGEKSPGAYMRHVEKTGGDYNGFNLLMGQKDRFWWHSNRGPAAKEIPPGFYGLSNHLLDTPWPKIKKSKAALEGMFTSGKIDAEAIFDALADRSFPPVQELPDTGVGLEWERMLSPVFIASPGYGTRSSSIVLMGKNGSLRFLEREFFVDKDGGLGQTTREFDL